MKTKDRWREGRSGTGESTDLESQLERPHNFGFRRLKDGNGGQWVLRGIESSDGRHGCLMGLLSTKARKEQYGLVDSEAIYQAFIPTEDEACTEPCCQRSCVAKRNYLVPKHVDPSTPNDIPVSLNICPCAVTIQNDLSYDPSVRMLPSSNFGPSESERCRTARSKDSIGRQHFTN